MAPTYLAGTAMTPFGRTEEDLVDLATAAGAAAMADARVAPEDIDALYLGTFLAQSLHRQGVLASLVARNLGLGNIATTSIEGACASAGIALRHASMAIRAGAGAVVLAVGVEKLTGHPVDEVTQGLSEALDSRTDQRTGLTFAGFFGLVASAHAARYGTTREQLSAVSVKNREHGASNPLAMFRKPVSHLDVAQSRLIADPLRLLDCSPIADGAAAAVVTRERPAGTAVRVAACAQSSGPVGIADIQDLVTFPATTTAAERAFADGDLARSDVDVVELHDCFTIAEIIDCEDLGLLPRGEAAAAIAEGATTSSSGGLVINPSGGLLSRGHPVGATGLAQIHELNRQLRGAADLQRPGAQVALAHNLGGCGATATVTLLVQE